MASRPIHMPPKEEFAQEIEPKTSQKKRSETGRYLLQVDRQIKGSYQTAAAADEVGRKIKSNYPVVQVSIYDRVDYATTILETPAPNA